MTTTAPAAGNVKLTSAATQALQDLATNGPARDSRATEQRADGRWVNHRIATTLVTKGYAYRILDGFDLWITPAGCEYLDLDPADVLKIDIVRASEEPGAAEELDQASVEPEPAPTEPMLADGPATLLGDQLPPVADPTTGEIVADAPSALAPPARYVVEIPLDDLHPAETNRAPRNIDELAEGIRAAGNRILLPLLVRRDGTKHGYEIIAGARRHAAARLVGLPTVPCLIEDDDALQIRQNRLIENLHRLDLKPIEEADAFAELVTDFKLTQADIATKVGRSEGHVSKRLSLRVLPDDVKDALTDERINIQTALGITGLVKTPDRLDIVVAALPAPDAANEQLERERQELDRVLAAQLREADRDRLRARVTAELEKAGETIVPYPKFGAWSSTEYRKCTAGETAEAYAVDDDGHAVKVTTQPLPEAERHTPNVPGAKKPAKPKRGETDDQRAEREAQEAALAQLDEQRADARTRRRTAARAALRHAGSDANLTAYLLDSIIGTTTGEEPAREATAAHVLTLLEVECAAAADRDVELRSYVELSLSNRWRAALAALLVGAEEELDWELAHGTLLQPGQFMPDPKRPGWNNRGEPVLVRYLELLQRFGYKPTDEELSALTAPDTTKAA